MSLQAGIGQRQSKRPVDQPRAGFGRALEHVLFGIIPVVVTLGLLAFELKIRGDALDFRVAYWPAVSRLIHGASPYTATRHDIALGWSFVYPALSAMVFAPFALISSSAGQVLWTLVCLACIPAILFTLNVRDWRVYGLVMLWSPVFDAWDSGNLTLLLTLAAALAWRHRDQPIVAGLLTAAAISLKPFVWPLALWLLATRRWRAAGWALFAGVVLNLAAWGVVGFGEIHAFLRLSGADAKALWRGGYSVMAVAHHLGFGRTAGEASLVVVSAAAAVALAYVGLVRRRERDAYILAVLLMLLASPLLWSHYFALLLIPLALTRPRLSLAWVVGLLMWPMPPRQPVFTWEELLAWGVTAVCVGIAMTSGPFPFWGVRLTALKQKVLQAPS